MRFAFELLSCLASTMSRLERQLSNAAVSSLACLQLTSKQQRPCVHMSPGAQNLVQNLRKNRLELPFIAVGFMRPGLPCEWYGCDLKPKARNRETPSYILSGISPLLRVPASRDGLGHVINYQVHGSFEQPWVPSSFGTVCWRGNSGRRWGMSASSSTTAACLEWLWLF